MSEGDDESGSDVIPWSLVIPLAVMQLVEAFNANSLFAYLTFMIVDFVPSVTSTDQAGTWSGVLGAAFYGGQFLSSFAWGVLSDRFGKRRILILGASGTFLTVLAFGFSRSFWWALVVRFLGGLLNGNIGVAKALLGQISTKRTQPRLFGLFGVTWGAGAIIAGAYGGLLARVAVKKPEWFAGTIFETFPYLLPNLVTAAFSALSLGLGFVYLYDPPLKPEKVKRDFRAVFQNKLAVLATLSYSLLGGAYTMLDELIPLWLNAQYDVGGLAFNTTWTGVALGLSGLCNLLVLLTIYVPVARWLGVVDTYRLGYLFGMCGVLILPWARYAAGSAFAVWAVLAIYSVMRALGGQFSFSSVFALISNSVTPQSMGAANGLGQMLVALFRMMAPVVAGPLFYWSVNPPDPGQRPWPVNFWLVFLVVEALFAGLFLMGQAFPDSLNAPAQTTEELEMEDLLSKE